MNPSLMGSDDADRGDHLLATQLLTKFIEMDPGNYELYHERSIIYHKLGDSKASIQDADVAIELNPDNIDCHYQKGVALLGSGIYKNHAIRSFKKTIELLARQETSKLSDIYNLIMRCINELQDARKKSQAPSTTTTTNTNTTNTINTANTTTTTITQATSSIANPVVSDNGQRSKSVIMTLPRAPIIVSTDNSNSSISNGDSSLSQSSTTASNGTQQGREESLASKNKRVKRDKERARRGTSLLCTITMNDLDTLRASFSASDGVTRRAMRVIAPIDGWLYAGELKIKRTNGTQASRSNETVGTNHFVVHLDGDRSQRDYFFSQQTILRDVIKEVKVSSVMDLRKGARICCYWSRQYRCLSTGVVTSRTFAETKSLVSVKYDNGDLSALPLDDIRLLPPDYPKFMSNCDPPSQPQVQQQQHALHQLRPQPQVPQQQPPLIQQPQVPQPQQTSIQQPQVPQQPLSIQQPQVPQSQPTSIQQPLVAPQQPPPIQQLQVPQQQQTSIQQPQVLQQQHPSVQQPQQQIPQQKQTSAQQPQVPQQQQASIQQPQMSQQQQTSIRQTQVQQQQQTSTQQPQVSQQQQASIQQPQVSQQSLNPRTTITAIRSQPKVCNLWEWDSPPKRLKRNNRVHREFYKQIRRNNEVISVGDSAELIPKDSDILPFIAKIDSMWANTRGEMRVKVRWYYRLMETDGPDLKLSDPDAALFETNHCDENDIQSIHRPCKVLSYASYKATNPDPDKKIFYLAGQYDPVKRVRHLRL